MVATAIMRVITLKAIAIARVMTEVAAISLINWSSVIKASLFMRMKNFANSCLMEANLVVRTRLYQKPFPMVCLIILRVIIPWLLWLMS